MEEKKYQLINVNRKSAYISFMSPTLKNKKGHKRQMTKSIKNINSDEEVDRLLQDTDDLLVNYNQYVSDYESFIKVYEKYDKKAISWVFEKTDIIDKYNQDSVMRTIEKKISVKNSDDEFIYPATLLIGASGAGKTTLIKQLIGSINTSFPATMQSNTTVGSMYVVVDNSERNLVACAKLINKSALEDRLENSYIKIIKEILTEGNTIENAKIFDILYDNITIFDDKKVKLQYILLKDNIMNDNLLSLIKEESNEIWNGFLKKSSEFDFNINKEFLKNTSVEFFTAFDLYIDEYISKTKIINCIMDIVEHKISIIIKKMYSEIKKYDDINVSINIVDEKKSVQLDESSNFSFPKILMLTFSYKQQRLPDNGLREKFFNILEYVSSANEEKQGETLFPIIEHIRIKGNFKPLWYKEKDFIENYILIDSEGIGHDITNQNVSMQLRTIMSKCNVITVIQNASEQMQTAFASTVKSLIYNGWIGKTRFCFNRMEMFDQKAHASVESKVSFIKSNIKNVLKQIITDEINSEHKIVSSREHIFEEAIIKKAYYLEYLKEKITSKNCFISSDKESAWGVIEKNNDIDESVKQSIKETFLTYFTEKFNPVDNINRYLKDIVSSKVSFTEEDMALLGIVPQYRADIFSSILNVINNKFAKDFLKELNSSPWQTVKAFNVRMASNWDNREWKNLQPEAKFIELANSNIMSYLLNPENINEINERNGYEFTMIIQQMISEEISDAITKIAEESIYLELLNDCWKLAAEFSDLGSTYDRSKLINEKIKNKFIVDAEKGKYNFLYKQFVDLVMENKYSKILNFKYR